MTKSDTVSEGKEGGANKAYPIKLEYQKDGSKARRGVIRVEGWFEIGLKFAVERFHKLL
jgi:hypothetical protein